MARPLTKSEQAECKKRLVEALMAHDGMLYRAAEATGIEWSTARRWMNEDEELALALERSREKAATDIQAHLMKMAKGEAPGGATGAAAFYLKAQAGWTDRQTIEHKGSVAWEGAPADSDTKATQERQASVLRLVAGSDDTETGPGGPPDKGAGEGDPGDSPPGNFDSSRVNDNGSQKGGK